MIFILFLPAPSRLSAAITALQRAIVHGSNIKGHLWYEGGCLCFLDLQGHTLSHPCESRLAVSAETKQGSMVKEKKSLLKLCLSPLAVTWSKHWVLSLKTSDSSPPPPPPNPPTHLLTPGRLLKPGAMWGAFMRCPVFLVNLWWFRLCDWNRGETLLKPSPQTFSHPSLFSPRWKRLWSPDPN